MCLDNRTAHRLRLAAHSGTTRISNAGSPPAQCQSICAAHATRSLCGPLCTFSGFVDQGAAHDLAVAHILGSSHAPASIGRNGDQFGHVDRALALGGDLEDADQPAGVARQGAEPATYPFVAETKPVAVPCAGRFDPLFGLPSRAQDVDLPIAPGSPSKLICTSEGTVSVSAPDAS